MKLLCGALALLVTAGGVFAAADNMPPPPPGKRLDIHREHRDRERHMRVLNAEDMPKEKVTYLGVETGRVSPTVAAQLGITERTGLTVLRVVEDSPAAGILEQHDILTKFNDQILVNEPQLSVLVRSMKPGDEVSLTFLRGAKETKARVKLGEQEVPKMAWREGFPHNIDLDNFRFEFGDAAGEWGEKAREWAEKAREMSGRVRDDVEHTLRVLRSDDGGGAHIFVDEGGPMKRVTRINKNRGNIVLVDDAGRVELKMKGDVRHAVVRNNDGKVLFEGPVASEADRAALTPEVRERLQKVESMVDMEFTLGDDAETKEVVPEVGKRGVAFGREAAPWPVRIYSL
ncbi:MAG TPA: PDZ domain-containing protein [Opitutaceae bacterium]|nr:PDZ domain-containing protein [Opitutaceae bacterium]